MQKYNKYILTSHAYIRAKQRIPKSIINNIETIDKFNLEIILNNFIKKLTSIDIEQCEEAVLFLIPGTTNTYIVTIDDLVITIKKSSIQNLLNFF